MHLRENYASIRAIHDTLSVLFPPGFLRDAAFRRRKFARRFCARRASRSARALSLSFGLVIPFHILGEGLITSSLSKRAYGDNQQYRLAS